MKKSELLDGVLLCVAGLFFGAVLYGWLAGCGEHYVDVNGITHTYECFK